MTAATESRTMMAPMGKPFAKGLAMVTMSGWAEAGKEEWAHMVPDRKRPHCKSALVVCIGKDRAYLYFIVDQNSSNLPTPLR